MQLKKHKTMIDTVILAIPRKRMITLVNTTARFPVWVPHSKTKGCTIYVKNMPKQKDDTDPYYPRLTGYIRNIGVSETSMVHIEFSITKLLCNNNLEEVEESYFLVVIDALHSKLVEMGESVTKADLISAQIMTFHPSKNIVITGGYTAYGIIKELSKINITRKFDLTKVTFKNEGQAVQLYSISHSVVFYDKIADMNQKPKKAVDKDQTPRQFSLFEEVKKRNTPLEVLRIEIRFKKRKMNEMLEKLGFQKNPTFKEIFKKDVCQKIVKWYWDTMVKGENLFLFELGNNPKQLLKDILRTDENIKAISAVTFVGLDVLCRDGDGIRELRSILEKRIKTRNWYVIGDRINKLNQFLRDRPLHNWVKEIEDTINSFSALKINNKSP